MENREERQSNSVVDGKIRTFASPTVLAAILDEQTLPVDEGVVQGMVDLNDQGQNSEIVADSLDDFLNDSLESTKFRESEDVIGGVVDTEELIFGKDNTISPLHLGFSKRVLDYPESSTPSKSENAVDEKSKYAKKASKPRRPQDIIERNKEQVGKQSHQKTCYARIHATKARNKLNEDKEQRTNFLADKNMAGTSGFDTESQLENVEQDFNRDLQDSSFENHVDQQIQHVNTRNTDLQQQENDSPQNRYLNGVHDIFQNHGPYYDVSQNRRLYNSSCETSYYNQAGTYSRDYRSAVDYVKWEPVQPLHLHSLSTQSAPPGVYGYERKPLVASLHTSHFHEDYYQPSVLLDSDKGYKIPESSLHRKFLSDPYLAQSSSSSLQKVPNVGSRNSKASGSYSSLREPFEYKPYTLKDYQNFAGSKVKPLAGGLGPNVDTDDFKEKMRKVSKQREYAAVIRAQHSVLRKQHERKGVANAPVKANHVTAAEKKREAALNYAKNVPKPKQVSKKKGSRSGRNVEDSGGDDEQEITVLDILRMRHEQEKKDVEIIRKELASKIRL